MAWKVNYDEVILFKKSDFPLLKNIDDYEKNMDLWDANDQNCYYAPDELIQSPSYRTYLYEKFQKNNKKDVKACLTYILFEQNNKGLLDFSLSDYYIFPGYHYQV